MHSATTKALQNSVVLKAVNDNLDNLFEYESFPKFQQDFAKHFLGNFIETFSCDVFH